MKKKHQDIAKIAVGAFILASAFPESVEAAASHTGYLAAGCGGKRSSSNDSYYWADNSSDVSSCRNRGSCSSKQGCSNSSDPSGKKIQGHSCGSQAPSNGSNHSCNSQSSNSHHSCSSQGSYAASCGAHGCGGSSSKPSLPNTSSGELADASEDITPATFPSNGKNKPAEGIISEAQLLKELSPQTRSMYLGLDDEGKALAVKIASRSADKNQAVKDAYRASMEKKGAGSR